MVALSITAVAASALLLGLTSSLQTTGDCLERTIAAGMAQQLLDEVLGARYGEFDRLLESGAKGTREDFDDISDFNGVRQQPPADCWGVGLGEDDGEGGRRHANFRISAGYFDRWRQEVEVYYVDPENLDARLPTGKVSDYRAVEVRIVYIDPERGRRVLSALRRVVAYVPAI
jgi:hypothetical protein